MASSGKKHGGLRGSLTSYADSGFSEFLRGASLASAGITLEDVSGPVIGIADTSSDFTPCHRQMPELVDAVSRGVLEAGGFPMRFPTMSISEPMTNPTSMVLRNLLALETEEAILRQPMDGVVLLGGCDKTVPAQLMAAASADVPAVQLVVGPMLTSEFDGRRVGACTDCRRIWSGHRRGEIQADEVALARRQLFPTAGTCMAMGTASTMACLAEAMGMSVPMSATAPAPTGERLTHGVETGRRIVELVRRGITAREVMSAAAFRNAAVVLAAIGGSTNAIIHLLAIAGRAGVDLSLEDLGRAAEETPVLVDCKPIGTGFLEDFHRAGGMPALLRNLRGLLDESAMTVSGVSLGELLDQMPKARQAKHPVGTVEQPVAPGPSFTVLRGSLAPTGAVMKVAAASPELFEHVGRAVVFESPADVAERIDDPSLGIGPDDVLVLRNSGPIATGMPESGWLPIPRYLGEKGVKDMVRISDGRMSGTAFGTTVLHCTPEAAANGPLALVETGDPIRLSVSERRLDLLVDEEELAARRSRLEPRPVPERGWMRLNALHLQQADVGADLDFLNCSTQVHTRSEG